LEPYEGLLLTTLSSFPFSFPPPPLVCSLFSLVFMSVLLFPLPVFRVVEKSLSVPMSIFMNVLLLPFPPPGRNILIECVSPPFFCIRLYASPSAFFRGVFGFQALVASSFSSPLLEVLPFEALAFTGLAVQKSSAPLSLTRAPLLVCPGQYKFSIGDQLWLRFLPQFFPHSPPPFSLVPMSPHFSAFSLFDSPRHR